MTLLLSLYHPLYQKKSFSRGAATRVLYLRKGKREKLLFNPQDGQIVLKEKTALQLSYINEKGKLAAFEVDVPVAAPLHCEGLVLVESLTPGKHCATLVHLLPDGTPNEEMTIQAYYFPVEISVDSSFDSNINYLDIRQTNWIRRGGENDPVSPAADDTTHAGKVPALGQYSEWSKLKINPVRIGSLPKALSLVLEISPRVAECCSIYCRDALGQFHHILGKNLETTDAPAISTSKPLSTEGLDCFIGAHWYPGNTSGLITLNLLLKHEEEIVSSDRALYRVAPWIIPPNTLAPAEVYVSQMEDSQPFIEALGAALDELGIPLRLVPKSENRGDRWIQDEIRFGYVQGENHVTPVVFDSPCNHGLDEAPEVAMLSPDFGHFQIENLFDKSLDTFGNLAVSPPVTVRGHRYPFGRIVTGGRRQGDFREQSRPATSDLRQFLYAQKLQSPFELYTDWLATGRVSGIVSFIPASNDKGFEVLVASPLSANTILTRLAHQGYAETLMFEGMKRVDQSCSPDQYKSAEMTIHELLEDAAFWEANQRYQSYLDLNIQILRKALGIDSCHIVHVPTLFHSPFKDGRAVACLPNMIDHLVLGNTSLLPKPKGPIIKGTCAFEAAFTESVPNRDVRFIDSWCVRREHQGEVRCATNTRRQPFSIARWRD